MSENVVPLHGDIPVAGRPSDDVITLLRDMLERAERGEIVGFAYASISPVGVPICDWAYQGAANGFVLVGTVSRLLYRLNKGQDQDA